MVSQTKIYFLQGRQLRETTAVFHEKSGGVQPLLTSAR
jgi:hypothetical protein